MLFSFLFLSFFFVVVRPCVMLLAWVFDILCMGSYSHTQCGPLCMLCWDYGVGHGVTFLYDMV